MSELYELSPQPLWRIFAKICSIPHPSHHEDKLAEYIINWANKRKLYIERDQQGNILIRKTPTKGMEKCKPLVLQAHLDMVPQKNNETIHDFTKDPIKPYIDGNWVKAQGTTLGADNGIGIASALGILDSNNLEHGPLEVLLTTNEETNMEGAFSVKPNWLNAEILINTDSEEEKTIYIGCAGGVNVTCNVPLSREENMPAIYQTFKLILKGLKGGHSGTDIQFRLGNANKLLACLLAKCRKILDIHLIDFQGGTLHNVIPNEAFAVIAITVDKLEQLKILIQNYRNILKKEILKKENNLTIEIQKISNCKRALTKQSRDIFVNLLNVMPNGVIYNSDEIKETVETSLNISSVIMKKENVEIHCLIRSLIDSGKKYVINILESLSDLAHAKIIVNNNYPCWRPNINSPILTLAHKTYQRIFNHVPNIKIIHAGLECGIFKRSYPNIDMISIGPTIVNPHSPNEQVDIGSVNNYWILLTELLKFIPTK